MNWLRCVCVCACVYLYSLGFRIWGGGGGEGRVAARDCRSAHDWGGVGRWAGGAHHNGGGRSGPPRNEQARGGRWREGKRRGERETHADARRLTE